jgi:hypothetical protein
MGNEDRIVKIRVRFIRETANGIVVTVEGSKSSHFLPFSQIEVQRESGPMCTVDLPEWLAIDRGLENEVV